MLVLVCLGCQKNVKNTATLTKFLQENIIESQTPGLAVSIIKEDSIVWQKGFGKANLEHETPMTTEGIINIASVSKTITATALMQLWEQGLVDLDSDINTYMPFSVTNPNFPEIPITFMQLLTHTSSILDSSVYENSYACGNTTIELKDWITEYLTIESKYNTKSAPFLNTEPGTTYNYSNIGYGLLAYLIEIITKTPFNQYCKENIFIPLKMNNTGWFLSEVNIQNHITPYLYITEENRQSIPKIFEKLLQDDVLVNDNNPLCLYGFPNYPDGQLRTSVSDLSKFLVAILNDGRYSGNQILKGTTIQMMLSGQTPADDKQGICWRYTGMEMIWGHGGDDPGVQTGIYFNPELRIGMICIKNNNEGSRTEILKELYQTAKNL